MIKPLGDSALIVYFENEISEDVLSKVHSLKMHIESCKLNYVREIVTSYNALALYYDPISVDYTCVKEQIEKLLDKKNLARLSDEIIDIPVYYDGEDLESVSRHTGLSTTEIIKLHTEPTYTIYMLGFSPGFPYLGGMDKRLTTPRRESPRLCIKAGSVGIAGEQTGIYSVDSPGGWQIIGQTPIKLFDIENKQSVLLKANMKLKFYEISKEEYIKWGC